MKCPICHKQNATLDRTLGVLPCAVCTARRESLALPNRPVEMAGEDIKRQRKEYAKSIIQPFRDGKVSKEYIEAYGPKYIKVTDKERKQAKHTLTDIYGRNFDLSKTK